MTDTFIRNALSWAATPDLVGLAGQLKSLARDVKLVNPPRMAVVMVRARESVEGKPFNLGELLVSECTACVDGVLGYGATAGTDLEKAEALALLDCALRSPWPESPQWLEFMECLKAAAAHCLALKTAVEASEAAAIAPSKVAFEAM